HARRTALAVLRQKNAVKKLFDNIAPRSTDRNGGYTRIIRLGQRKSDSASIAFIEWVDAAQAIEEKTPKESKEKPAKAKKKTKPAAQESAPPQKETPPPAKEQEPAPAKEPKHKKRKWFGKRS